MRIFKWHHLLVSVVLLVSCSPDKISLDHFDAQAWRNDLKGCNGARTPLAEVILAQKDKLLGLNEIEVVNALGKPDQQEIYKRHEKFYYYFVDPSADCDEPRTPARRLSIRFNAVGLSKEIVVE
mgnify:CR=1 FL=1|jgi:hypothetical protein